MNKKTLSKRMIAPVIMAIVLIVLAKNTSSAKEIHFENDHAVATVESYVTGNAIQDYTFAGTKGRILMVVMDGGVHFDLFPPKNVSPVPIFSSTASTNEYEGELTATGNYVIRVSQRSDAAKEGKTTNFKLAVGFIK